MAPKIRTAFKLRSRGGKAERVFRKTRETLRTLYLEKFGRAFPENDEYLDMLWRDVCSDTPKTEQGAYRIKNTEMYATCVMRMRENHVFEDT